MMEHDFTAMILLAQDGAAPPTEGAGGAQPLGTTGAPGSPAGAPRSAGGDLLGSNFIWLLLLMVGAMVVFSMMGSRRERRRRDAMLSALKRHDKVQTIGGVIGSVVEVKTNTVVLKVDESSNTRMTFARSAIQQVLDVAPDSSSSSAATGA